MQTNHEKWSRKVVVFLSPIIVKHIFTLNFRQGIWFELFLLDFFDWWQSFKCDTLRMLWAQYISCNWSDIIHIWMFAVTFSVLLSFSLPFLFNYTVKRQNTFQSLIIVKAISMSKIAPTNKSIDVSNELFFWSIFCIKV